MASKLEGKVALVTEASSEMGKATAIGYKIRVLCFYRKSCFMEQACDGLVYKAVPEELPVVITPFQ